MLVAAPFFRYLVGTVLLDSGGSLLAVGLLHASFNAAGALELSEDGGWQYIPAMILITLIVAAYRARRGGNEARAPGSREAATSR